MAADGAEKDREIFTDRKRREIAIATSGASKEWSINLNIDVQNIKADEIKWM